MLQAIKNFFSVKKDDYWMYDRNALMNVLPGFAIIDNAGITGGWAPVEWRKNFDGTWSNRSSLEPLVVNDDYFQMPFAVVDADILVSH